MRRTFLLSSVVLANALALGCADQPSPLAPAGDSPAPSLGVARSEQTFGFGFGNEEYAVLIAVTAENWATFCATGEQNWDTWQIFTVTRPDGSTKDTWTGDAQHVLVWENPADVCAETPDFTGTARMILTDSDVDLSGHGTDASGLRVTGKVTDASGHLFHLHANALQTVAPEFTSIESFEVVSRVNKIEVTPIGR